MDMSLGKLQELGDGQQGLACCGPWCSKELGTTERLNWTCNAGDSGSVPGQATKIPHVTEKLSPQATTTEPESHKETSHMMQLRPKAAK